VHVAILELVRLPSDCGKECPCFVICRWQWRRRTSETEGWWLSSMRYKHKHSVYIGDYMLNVFCLKIHHINNTVLTGLQCKQHSMRAINCTYTTVWVKKNHPLRGPDIFFHFFTNGLEFLFDFLHTYCIFLSMLDYKFLFNYPQLLCSKCPPSAKMHAFRRLRKSLLALLIVVWGKSLLNKPFYNVNKHAGYDMMSTMT